MSARKSRQEIFSNLKNSISLMMVTNKDKTPVQESPKNAGVIPVELIAVKDRSAEQIKEIKEQNWQETKPMPVSEDLKSNKETIKSLLRKSSVDKLSVENTESTNSGFVGGGAQFPTPLDSKTPSDSALKASQEQDAQVLNEDKPSVIKQQKSRSPVRRGSTIQTLAGQTRREDLMKKHMKTLDLVSVTETNKVNYLFKKQTSGPRSPNKLTISCVSEIKQGAQTWANVSPKRRSGNNMSPVLSPKRFPAVDRSMYKASGPDFSGVSELFDIEKRGNRIVYSPKPKSPARNHDASNSSYLKTNTSPGQSRRLKDMAFGSESKYSVQSGVKIFKKDYGDSLHTFENKSKTVSRAFTKKNSSPTRMVGMAKLLDPTASASAKKKYVMSKDLYYNPPVKEVTGMHASAFDTRSPARLPEKRKEILRYSPIREAKKTNQDSLNKKPGFDTSWSAPDPFKLKRLTILDKEKSIRKEKELDFCIIENGQQSFVKLLPKKQVNQHGIHDKPFDLSWDQKEVSIVHKRRKAELDKDTRNQSPVNLADDKFKSLPDGKENIGIIKSAEKAEPTIPVETIGLKDKDDFYARREEAYKRRNSELQTHIQAKLSETSPTRRVSIRESCRGLTHKQMAAAAARSLGMQQQASPTKQRRKKKDRAIGELKLQVVDAETAAYVNVNVQGVQGQGRQNNYTKPVHEDKIDEKDELNETFTDSQNSNQ